MATYTDLFYAIHLISIFLNFQKTCSLNFVYLELFISMKSYQSLDIRIQPMEFIRNIEFRIQNIVPYKLITVSAYKIVFMATILRILTLHDA